MRFRLKLGKKGDKDLVLLVCTDGEEQLELKDLFAMVKQLYDNEDRIYPPPKFRGSKMLLDALDYLRTHTVDETLLEFQLRKARYLHDFM